MSTYRVYPSTGSNNIFPFMAVQYCSPAQTAHVEELKSPIAACTHVSKSAKDAHKINIPPRIRIFLSYYPATAQSSIKTHPERAVPPLAILRSW